MPFTVYGLVEIRKTDGSCMQRRIGIFGKKDEKMLCILVSGTYRSYRRMYVDRPKIKIVEVTDPDVNYTHVLNIPFDIDVEQLMTEFNDHNRRPSKSFTVYRVSGAAFLEVDISPGVADRAEINMHLFKETRYASTVTYLTNGI